MEFDYQGLKKARRTEIDAIISKYMKTKVILPKKASIKPLCCIVWQSGNLEKNYGETLEKQINTLRDDSTGESTMAKKGDVNIAFEKSVNNAFKNNIIIGYLFSNQAENPRELEYIFHYSKQGIDIARLVDDENSKNGIKSNSFFKSFLYRKIFQDENKVYVSRGVMFPIFKEKLLAIKNRSGEILEESSKTGRSVLEVSTTDISNDFLLIGSDEEDIERYYKKIIRFDYTGILTQSGLPTKDNTLDVELQRKKAEAELKNSMRDFAY